MEEEIEIDAKEAADSVEEAFEKVSWVRYLTLSTVIIAVIAAIASLMSGTYSNEAVLEKNNAVLLQNKASDQWSYYQAKGIKKNIADTFHEEFGGDSFKTQSTQYGTEQVDIKKQAEDLQKQVEEANKSSEHSLEKHHKTAYSVTFFQIAIALSALSSLMKRKSFFVISLLFAFVGIMYLSIGVTI